MKGLPPLGMAGSDHQGALLDAEGMAMGGQLGTGNPRPVLPESCQGSLFLPVALNILKKACKMLCRGWCCLTDRGGDFFTLF